MLTLFFCLLTIHCQAQARSSRTVYLAEGEMTPIYVEPGYSTLLKFKSHPEPGLIGDQDGFKVEYTKNIVAIKPLLPRGKTNLFVFTKDAQFGFQLIASLGKHDNEVYVDTPKEKTPPGLASTKSAVWVDDILTKKVMKSDKAGDFVLTFESLATPASRATVVLRVRSFQLLHDSKTAALIDPNDFSLHQGSRQLKIENVFLEIKSKSALSIETSVLILIRASDLKKGEPLKLTLTVPEKSQNGKPTVLNISTPADLR